MDKKMLEKAQGTGKVFKIGDSFFFAVQVPDDSVGCSGSRCSNCNHASAYCHQVCRQCGLPFVGPFGFPQLPEWMTLSLDRKEITVKEIYCQSGKRGRLGYANVELFPLTPCELRTVECLKSDDARLFLAAHDVGPQKAKERLIA